MTIFRVIQREPISETSVRNTSSMSYSFIAWSSGQDFMNLTYLISFTFMVAVLLISIRSKIDPKDMDKTIHAVNTVSGLLQGPFDVGNALVGHQGIMEMMVALCGSERNVDQMVAVEALIHSSSKMSRASFFITNGVSLLKDIYKKTKDERIKIRALVVSLHIKE